mgnify:CR=1 FL=1
MDNKEKREEIYEYLEFFFSNYSELRPRMRELDKVIEDGLEELNKLKD